ncbi:hypothetical protein VCR4J2_630003 [Vibrio coralliirubri]|nr:hypothetical protein VCR4J2_630003 [Vibrio coralliirubri]
MTRLQYKYSEIRFRIAALLKYRFATAVLSVEALINGKIAEWKSGSGYHYRSISETAMSRYKGLTSGKLSLRCYNAQVGKIMANVKAMNKIIGLGMPVRS